MAHFRICYISYFDLSLFPPLLVVPRHVIHYLDTKRHVSSFYRAVVSTLFAEADVVKGITEASSYYLLPSNCLAYINIRMCNTINIS